MNFISSLFSHRYRSSSIVLALALAVSASFVAGCGSSPASNVTAPTIAAQPASQSTPLGQTATFAVTAVGTAPLQYQWSRNGTAINGANAATYTTPPVDTGDSGSTFTVTVSNAVGSVTSNLASLTVGPRSPQASDLRFQLVDSAFTVNGYGNAGPGLGTAVAGRMAFSFGNYYGTPLSAGSNCTTTFAYGCYYFLQVFPLPVGVPNLEVNYQADLLDYFDTDLGQIVSPNTVITSLFLEPIADDFGVSWTQTPQATGFQYAQNTVALADLQAFATQQGTAGRVITAASFDASGNVFVVSYGWQNDTTTVYEAQVATATLDAVTTDAASLAAQGYIISALGAGNELLDGTPSNGLVLIGTRVQGDTMPRPLQTAVTPSEIGQLFDQGYAIVGQIRNPNGFVTTWIGEK